MDKAVCSHCEGSGKTKSIVHLDTGEAEYRPCAVCGGSGEVAVDRQYYSYYPDVSLRHAQELIGKLGKPVEVLVETNDDVHLLFAGGGSVVLGGFAVGYRGTGPDFFKRLLDASGFNVSMDEIATMQAPVTLKRET